ncbi:mechanosensitive ion channel family protein [Halobacteriaceae archaeon GCM10025711]
MSAGLQPYVVLQAVPDVSQYADALVGFLVTVAVFLVAFAVAYWVGRSLLVRLTERALESRGFKPDVVSLAASVARVTALAAAVALAATVAGFGTILVAFATLAGALTLAVGFATQDLISNFVAGVFILKDEPFQSGDWIEWNDNAGVVRDIQLRVTTLDTFDNEQVTVPNSELANNAVVNPVANDTLRVTAEFGIGYADDIAHAQDVVLEAGEAIDGVLDEPAPDVLVTGLGDSAVILTGRVWVDPDETSPGAVRAAFVTAVKERFDAEGIDMPYPHRQLTGDVNVAQLADADVA